MEWISDRKILIVGLGHIGGSYARALKRLGFHIWAVDKDPDTIAYALEHKIIDRGQTEPDEALLKASDVLIIALYPTTLLSWMETWAHCLQPGTMITDVTGVKRCVALPVQAMLPAGVEFVPSHPMAGTEHAGVAHSDDKIFRGANYIVTPTEHNTPQGIEWCRGLGRILGCEHIAVMTPEEHDEMIGFVSQLAHCIAVSLMTCSDNEHLAEYTGDSFRDLTRIARINDEMWSELFLLNRDRLLEQMDRFAGEFLNLRQLLSDGDREGMREKMRLATRRRERFNR